MSIPTSPIAILLSVLFLAGCGRQDSTQPTSPSSQSSLDQTISRKTDPPSALSSGIGQGPRSALSSARNLKQRSVVQPQSEFQGKDVAVRKLVDQFFHSEPEAQDDAIDSLFGLGTTDAIGALVYILQCLQPCELKTDICQKLSQMDTRNVRDYLLGLMPSAEPETRRALAIALGAQADSGLVMRLVDQFDSASDENEKASAKLVMSAIVSPEATETLAAVVTDPTNGMSDPMVAAAAQALARSASAPSVSTLLRKMGATENPDEAHALGELIEGITSPLAESALIYAAGGNKDASAPEVRLAAVRALANFPSAESLQVLRRLEKDQDPAIQAASKDIANKIQSVLGR
jgi:HEAT repeat protein